MTLPANASGYQASETYEYDRALDATGITNLNGSAVAGRGLVTKITYADNGYRRFKEHATGTSGGRTTNCTRPRVLHTMITTGR